MDALYRFRINEDMCNIIAEKLHSDAGKSSLSIAISGTGYAETESQTSCSITPYTLLECKTIEEFLPHLYQCKSNCAITIFHLSDDDSADTIALDIKMITEAGINLEKYQLVSCFVGNDLFCNAYIYSVDARFSKMVDVSSVAGGNIKFKFPENITLNTEWNLRTEQAFGKGTMGLLSELSIGVVGVSGTGSIVAEQLSRLQVGQLILVDDDKVEEKNLNRILNSTHIDAETNKNKAEMMAQTIRNSGSKCVPVALPTVLGVPATIRVLSQCDVIFGCVDSADGRDQMNQLSSYYCIPYFDLGVKMVADGNGGIEEISGAVHYIKPGGSSLMSRHVYSPEDVAAASLLRNDKEEYLKRLEAKYIKGAKENSPAVISVNMQVASWAVLDFLDRLHQYRVVDNNLYESIHIDITETAVWRDSITPPCKFYGRNVGRGDKNPLLGMPSLSEKHIGGEPK